VAHGIRIGLAATAAVGLLAGGPGLAVGAHAAAAKGARATISLRRTAHGKVLVGPHGRSLYVFRADTRNHSNCGPACRKHWPPVTSTGKPRAGAGVSARHLAVIKGHQVTYYGHPLYTFFKDTRAGQTKGEGVFAFGNYWYLDSAKGSIA
jgi:predicted lipoprotein with Yx(FWY)xxD motif